jgi:uncharacterized radical SAM superfamily Fe-S cluster-containing enzyme
MVLTKASQVQWEVLLENTASACPVCKAVMPAQLVERSSVNRR